jgi:hypothetical protein
MFLLCGAVSLYYQLGFETSAATKTVDVHGGDIYIPELSITMDQAWAQEELETCQVSIEIWRL